MYNEALCEKTWCPLILNMVSVDISMVKICLVNKFMVISSLHTGCPAKHVHFFYNLSAKTINPNTKFGGASNKVEKTYRCEALKYFRVEVEKTF